MSLQHHSNPGQHAPFGSERSVVATNRDIDFWQTAGVRRAARAPSTSGEALTVFINHYAVKIDTKLLWYLYDGQLLLRIFTPRRLTPMTSRYV